MASEVLSGWFQHCVKGNYGPRYAFIPRGQLRRRICPFYCSGLYPRSSSLAASVIIWFVLCI